MDSVFIYPTPQSLVQTDGFLETGLYFHLKCTGDLQPVFDTARTLFQNISVKLYEEGQTVGNAVPVVLTQAFDIAPEGYRLTIGPADIQIDYGDNAGAFYGLISLFQMIQSRGATLPCCRIEDAPGLKIRGVMLDISRGKVPTLKTLQQTADRLAQFKLNHMELYIEGFSYAYPNHTDVWKENSSLTAEEFARLDRYCQARFIDLVPCQNSLGHMGPWLQTDRYHHLAECEDGFSMNGIPVPPGTLNITDPESFSFVSGLFDELLPAFTSKNCNVCMDEPFELCEGKNKALSAEKDALYIDYANRLNDYLKGKGKRMMMWGDIVGKNPALLDSLSRDILLLDWGYEAEHPVHAHAAALAAAGQPFCVCPGTNTWTTFTGLTDNMLTCIENAADAAYKYNAEGMIITDWGDLGHLQYLPVSWAGILTAAAYAWNPEPVSEELTANALDCFVFEDNAHVMGRFCMDAGRYAAYEEFRMPCKTLASLVLISGLVPRERYEFVEKMFASMITFFAPKELSDIYLRRYAERKEFQPEQFFNYIKALSLRLEQTDLKCADAALVKTEYENALKTVAVLTKVRGKSAEELDCPTIKKELNDIISTHRKLWAARNKTGGCEEGLAPLVRIREALSK